MSMYPALSQTKFDNYLENSIEPDNPFADFDYSEKTFEIIAEQNNWQLEIPAKDIALFSKNSDT